MSSGTSIEWTDATWNPIRARVLREAGPGRAGWHCEKVSPGCANCYAERFNGRGLPNGGTRLSYTKGSRAQVETFVDEDVLREPLRWRKPRRVFVESMSDLFGEWVSDEQIAQVFGLFAWAPQHTFQVLTKRPERMRKWFHDFELTRAANGWFTNPETDSRWNGPRTKHPTPRGTWPLPNVWLGVSAEDQQRADERIPFLLATPAAVRFVSAEPLLGPIDFRAVPYQDGNALFVGPMGGHEWAGARRDLLSWVIVGGESGPGARPCDVAWIRSIVEQCRAAGTACFVKQLGARPFERIWDEQHLGGYRCDGKYELDRRWLELEDSKGGDPSEWPEDLRVREFPREAVRS